MHSNIIKEFHIDYDPEQDSLFLFDPHNKSKASVELGDLIIDYTSQKEIVGLELLHASNFFDSFGLEDAALQRLRHCRMHVHMHNGFLLLRLFLSFNGTDDLLAPIIVPAIKRPSPAL